MRARARLFYPLASLAASLLATPAHAVDGVVEVNQASALAGEVSPGDLPDFPVTLSRPGSYRLTSDLVAPSGTTAVQVIVSDVSIDLNGFQISCVTITGGCGYGVDANGQNGLSIRDGGIRGFKLGGVIGGDRIRISRLRAVDNGDPDFGGEGINVGDSSLVEWSTVSGSRGIGIGVGFASTVTDSRVVSSGSWGLFAGPGSVVTGNSAYQNGAGGIWVGGGSTVRGNSSLENAETGILAVGACTVVENTVSGNGGIGLELGDNSGYAGNVVFDNTGVAISGGRSLGANLCDGAPCPAPCQSTCANDIAVVDRYDVATGSCVKHFVIPCAPYACDLDGSCRTSCVSAGDCAEGGRCDSGTCAAAFTTCSSQSTVLLPNGTETDCTPYSCQAGACMERCTLPNDCAPSYTCVGNSCVP